MFRIFVLLLSAVLAAASSGDSNGTTVNFDLNFDRVMIVVLENQPLSASMKNPLMRDIIKRGTLLTEYYAMVNPSQPNYIGLLAGDLLGVSGDGVFNLPQTNLVDLMEAKGITWKAYQENYPGNCFSGDTSDGLYKRKHNPFISFDNIRNNPTRCKNIVDSAELSKDLAAGTVPQYSFYTPNMNNNGHDTGLDFTASWLYDTFLPTYLIPFNNTGNALLVVTFDEGVPANNRIFTVLIGSMIPQGYIDSTSYTHYSLLRLIEDNFELGSLNRHDATATRITTEHFVEGTYLLGPDGITIALIVALPLAALFMVGVFAYSLHVHRRHKMIAQKVKLAEFATLLGGEADV